MKKELENRTLPVTMEKLSKICSKKYYKIVFLRDNSLVYRRKIASYNHSHVPQYFPEDEYVIIERLKNNSIANSNYFKFFYNSVPVILPLESAKGFVHNFLQYKLCKNEKLPYYKAIKQEFDYIEASLEDVLIDMCIASNEIEARHILEELEEWRRRQMNDIYKEKLKAIRAVLVMLKADEGFSTCYSLEDIANAADINYRDIEDLEND